MQKMSRSHQSLFCFFATLQSSDAEDVPFSPISFLFFLPLYRVLMQKMSRDRVKQFEKNKPSDAEIKADPELT